MPNHTPNYNLTKPYPAENYDINIFNENFNIIDTALKNSADKISELETTGSTGTNNFMCDTFIIAFPDYSIQKDSTIFENQVGYVQFMNVNDNFIIMNFNVIFKSTWKVEKGISCSHDIILCTLDEIKNDYVSEHYNCDMKKDFSQMIYGYYRGWATEGIIEPSLAKCEILISKPNMDDMNLNITAIISAGGATTDIQWGRSEISFTIIAPRKK